MSIPQYNGHELCVAIKLTGDFLSDMCLIFTELTRNSVQND